jgi:nitrite reductase/ring-hydroxylating ferredoxin subunit
MLLLMIFAAALVLRLQESISFVLITVLEVVGVCLLSISGWLGGTLVYRNQIGVDIRYAQAGKWKEEYIDSVEEEITVASPDELKTNQMKLVHLNGKRIVIGKTEKGYTAFDDHCTHRGGSLAGGAMICGNVQCPWHGSQFDVYTGTVMAGPAKENIKTYIVKEVAGKIILQTTESI